MIALTAVFFVCIAIAVACCCGPLGFLSGRAWALRNPTQPSLPHTLAAHPHEYLYKLAKLIETGGEAAVASAAADLAVTPDAVRAWWVQWQMGHRGPSRC